MVLPLRILFFPLMRRPKLFLPVLRPLIVVQLSIVREVKRDLRELKVVVGRGMCCEIPMTLI